MSFGNASQAGNWTRIVVGPLEHVGLTGGETGHLVSSTPTAKLWQQSTSSIASFSHMLSNRSSMRDVRLICCSE
jgi:hypothetical protein